MARTRSGSLPSYRLYKRTGQAVVTINGHDHYLGEHGSAESKEKYHRLIGEWLAQNAAPDPESSDPPIRSVSEIILAYWEHANEYYRDSPVELEKIRLSLRPVRQLYGSTEAHSFGPLALRAVREEMIRTLSRTTINVRIGVIKRAFKWAVSHELIPSGVYQGLRTVEGLKRGRSQAKESEPVKPVTEEQIEATLPLLNRFIRAMVQVQLLSGARPGEICILRTCDVDINGQVWTFVPQRHKTQYRGKDRHIYFGPQAQELLTPFLEGDPEAYVFSPRKAMQELRQ